MEKIFNENFDKKDNSTENGVEDSKLFLKLSFRQFCKFYLIFLEMFRDIHMKHFFEIRRIDCATDSVVMVAATDYEITKSIGACLKTTLVSCADAVHKSHRASSSPWQTYTDYFWSYSIFYFLIISKLIYLNSSKYTYIIYCGWSDNQPR